MTRSDLLGRNRAQRFDRHREDDGVPDGLDLVRGYSDGRGPEHSVMRSNSIRDVVVQLDLERTNAPVAWINKEMRDLANAQAIA